MSLFDDLDLIVQNRAAEMEQRDRVLFDRYLNTLIGQLHNGYDVVSSTVDRPQPREDGTYICIKEPVEFIHKFEDISNNKDACRKRFLEYINNRDPEVIEQILWAGSMTSDLWFNSTANRVNLRPGLQDNEQTKPTVVSFGNPEDNVHAIIVGATGSGKSVFLHNLLFSMMAEYAPWELNLFLVDFKKVSFSKYLSECDTPHIKAVAATGEVRYVVSLLDYLDRCMRARQTFFSYLGIEKISQLRDHKNFGAVLPRCVLMIDEFQQMFLDASTTEESRIAEILTSITKLGRATGYHLIFASQEMSGLGDNAFANFKIRFALRCSRSVSSTYLGNPAACDEISNRERGIVIENSGDGTVDDNHRYKIPFVDDKSNYFSSFLRQQVEMATQAGYFSNHKYYQEDYIRSFQKLEQLLSHPAVFREKQYRLQTNPNFFDILTLGDAVVFNYKKHDFETVFLERGSKKNIGIFSPSIRDLTYMCKLLATNFKASPNVSQYKHFAIIRNDLFLRNYDMVSDLGIPSDYVKYTDDSFAMVLDIVKRRKENLSLIRKYHDYPSMKEFAADCIRNSARYMLSEERLNRFVRETDENGLTELDHIAEYFRDAAIENIPQIINDITEKDPRFKDAADYWFENLILLYNAEYLQIPYNNLFAPWIVWVIGTEMIDSLHYSAEKLFADASAYQVLFVFAGSAISDNFSSFYNSCDYLFVAGNMEDVYYRFDIRYTKKSQDSKVIDFKIRSANTMRSFKKFYLGSEDKQLDSLSFDDLLRGDDAFLAD